MDMARDCDKPVVYDRQGRAQDTATGAVGRRWQPFGRVCCESMMGCVLTASR